MSTTVCTILPAMGGLLDYIALLVVRATLGTINIVPLRLRLYLMRALIRIVCGCLPSFKRVSLKNIALVFPDKDEAFHQEIYQRSFDNLARVLVDFARLHTLSLEWIRTHVSCSFLPRFLELKSQANGKGVLIATGHLGSFELMAHSIGMLGHPISFVVRNFNLPRLDAWWTKNREQSGNKVIFRQGAVKKVFASIQDGRDVALLFDQNVKRNHAVFVPWFGKSAATTMTIGISAVRLEAKLVVCSMHYVGDDKYDIDAEECCCDDIYRDETLSTDAKVALVTERATKIFERMILRSPEGWFWMHRRWKTQPEGIREDFYR